MNNDINGGFSRNPGAGNIGYGGSSGKGKDKDTWARHLGDRTDGAWWWIDCGDKGEQRLSQLTCRVISTIY